MRGKKIRNRFKGMRPFVFAAEKIEFNGTILAVPVGVELATCSKQAWKQAVRRWPYHTLLEPGIWERVPPDVRLAALEADRRM